MPYYKFDLELLTLTFFRDTLIVSLGNCSTSIFAGFVIYSYLGNLAHEMNTSVDVVSKDGKSFFFLAFRLSSHATLGVINLRRDLTIA